MSATFHTSRLHQLFFILAAVASCTLAETKRFTTPDNFTYVYDHVPAVNSQPTVLLLHGYPSSRRDWHQQVADLSAAGFGVLALDNLGYGDSDKPLDIQAYSLKALAGHLDAILSNEGLDVVVGVGHDWGVNVLSRAAVWYPKRFEKLAFISVPYSPPGILFDVDATNVNGLESFGYMQLGYWYFFNSYYAADLISNNVSRRRSSFFSMIKYMHFNPHLQSSPLANSNS